MLAIQGHAISKMISNGFRIRSIHIGRRGWSREDEHDGEIQPADDSQGPVEQQYKEIYALARKAPKTLAEARQTVCRTRQARGYFAPEAVSSKGISGSYARRSSAGGFPKGRPFLGRAGRVHIWKIMCRPLTV